MLDSLALVPSTKITPLLLTSTSMSFLFLLVFVWFDEFLFGSSFSKPGGATSAARIMKMMSKTNSTSVNGVMLISAITSSSCFAESSPTVRYAGAGLLDGFGWLIQVGGNRRAGIVEVQHLGELVGRNDHLLIVVLDARLEVVEKDDRDDGDDQTAGGGDQRFRDAGRDDRRGRVAFEGDILERLDDAQHGSEQADERRDDGDGADDRQIALECVQVLHERDR